MEITVQSPIAEVWDEGASLWQSGLIGFRTAGDAIYYLRNILLAHVSFDPTPEQLRVEAYRATETAKMLELNMAEPALQASKERQAR